MNRQTRCSTSGRRTRRGGRAATVLGLGIALALVGVGCRGAEAATDDAGTPVEADGSGNGDPTVVRVFGAASLTDAFGDLEAAFEAGHPQYDVELNLAGSSGLREQIFDGAPVDVFASANESVMDQVVTALSDDGTVVEQPLPFAGNRLTIAVPVGNPALIGGLEDFARPELFIGLCAEAVPCGELADEVLRDAAVEPSVDTRESDVRALLTKVETGELDAGIVYGTDVLASDSVEGVELPATVDAAAGYPVAVLDQGDSVEGGRAFMSFLLSDEGQQILADHGFGAP